ncbi:MAG: DUF1611 domain-containing protein [Gammaproteobacteria bacterium]|nr:DUF1611 domain-containing protein [Gammaproteobacteria bacterium]
MKIKTPYLLFLGDATDDFSIKMARGVADWRPELCTGQFRLAGCGVTTGQPDMSMEQAKQAGAKTLVLGLANNGGVITPEWIPYLIEALNHGFDIVSGLHDKLNDIAQLKALADELNLQLIDIRHPQQKFKTGTGEPRSGKRLITVGTDCSAGKMYTALSLERAMKKRGMNVDFRATGQSGILIAGSGVAIDCVVADFIAGACEGLSPANSADHWDVIEGQGSLYHPAFAGVSLGLLHGAQADALVVCHVLNRDSMRGLKQQALPSLADTIALNVAAARVTNPQAKVIGISINTSSVSSSEALDICRTIEQELGLPCVDPIRHGVNAIIDQISVEQ